MNAIREHVDSLQEHLDVALPTLQRSRRVVLLDGKESADELDVEQHERCKRVLLAIADVARCLESDIGPA